MLAVNRQARQFPAQRVHAFTEGQLVGRLLLTYPAGDFPGGPFNEPRSDPDAQHNVQRHENRDENNAQSHIDEMTDYVQDVVHVHSIGGYGLSIRGYEKDSETEISEDGTGFKLDKLARIIVAQALFLFHNFNGFLIPIKILCHCRTLFAPLTKFATMIKIEEDLLNESAKRCFER